MAIMLGRQGKEFMSILISIPHSLSCSADQLLLQTSEGDRYVFHLQSLI